MVCVNVYVENHVLITINHFFPKYIHLYSPETAA